VAKRQKYRQCNGQRTEEQTIQWPKDRSTDNTVAKRQKHRQYSGKKQNIRQEMIHKKLKIEQNKLHTKYNWGMSSVTPKG
jgi:hypothetical protein